jgi:hypothetical protein
MTDTAYPQCVAELYRSEVLGEAVFLALWSRAKSEEQRYKFATLLQLETETKARLRPLLAKYGLGFDGEDASAPAASAAADFEAGGWSSFVEGTLNVVHYFVGRFEQIERLGPAEDAEILHSMVVHERAIQDFLEAERDGRPEGSLRSVIALLQYPLPNPHGF